MGRGKSWTSESDQALCLAWLQIMQDPQSGAPQGSITFWTRARAVYERSVDNTRTSRALQSRWSILSLSVRRFTQVYDQIRASAEGHESEGDLITSALKKYHLIHPKKEVFEQVGCWQVLRNAPSWIETCSKKIASSGSSGNEMAGLVPELEWKPEEGQEEALDDEAAEEAGREIDQIVVQEPGQEAGQDAKESEAGSEAGQIPVLALAAQPQGEQEPGQGQANPGHPPSTDNGVYHTAVPRAREVSGSAPAKVVPSTGRPGTVQERILAQLEEANRISEEKLKVHKMHTYAFILSLDDDQIPLTSKFFFNDARTQILNELRESHKKEIVKKRLAAVARDAGDSKKKAAR